MSVTWPDDVDEILAGDLAAGFAYLTPAKGVVITPMAPLGIRDRDAGTVTLSTSLGLWRKLDRIRRNPGVAVAYHAREHGLTDRPGFVLVQGRASFDPEPDREWLESITPEWDRFLGPRLGGHPRQASERLLLGADRDHDRRRARRELARDPGRGHAPDLRGNAAGRTEATETAEGRNRRRARTRRK